MIFNKKINLLTVLIVLSGCASNANKAPIESFGTTQSDIQVDKLDSMGILDINNLSKNVHNYDKYTNRQIHSILIDLTNIPCQRVNFAFDSFKLTSKAKSCLNEVAKYLIKHNQPIKLSGNTDPVGSEKYNFNLGQKRANATAEYLLSQGVAKQDICTVSFGELRPAVSPKNLYNEFCQGSINTVCKEKAKQAAYYYDRRTDLEFGLTCS